MNSHSIRKGVILIVLFWLGVVGLSFGWNHSNERAARRDLAFMTGRAFFQQIVVTRSWNAEHGGVYVPLRPGVEPNPYLEDPLRDLTTNEGIHLTKINPAYMTRQIAEIAAEREGLRFHITSLKPIRPENRAEPWEADWLRSFEEGVTEQGTFVTKSGRPFFRYMAPLPVEARCLKCHAKQGYRQGDIRGGISVTLPHFSMHVDRTLLLAHVLIALLGTTLIVAGGHLLNRKALELLASNDSLKAEVTEHQRTIGALREANEQIRTLSGVLPICMHCKEIRDDQGYWNQLEKFITDHSDAQFSHGICEKCLKKFHGNDPD